MSILWIGSASMGFSKLLVFDSWVGKTHISNSSSLNFTGLAKLIYAKITKKQRVINQNNPACEVQWNGNGVLQNGCQSHMPISNEIIQWLWKCYIEKSIPTHESWNNPTQAAQYAEWDLKKISSTLTETFTALFLMA